MVARNTYALFIIYSSFLKKEKYYFLFWKCGVQDLPKSDIAAANFGFASEDIGDYIFDVLARFGCTYESSNEENELQVLKKAKTDFPYKSTNHCLSTSVIVETLFSRYGIIMCRSSQKIYGSWIIERLVFSNVPINTFGARSK